MLNRTTAAAGLMAIAATAGTLLTVPPASALSPGNAPRTAAAAQIAAVHAPAAPAVHRGDGDGGWWWWASERRFQHRHHSCGGFCGQGVRHRFHGAYGDGGFGPNADRNVNVVTNDVNIGVQNSNTYVAVTGGY